MTPSLIMVDVEGSELMVLKGGREVIAREMPALILEHHGECRRHRLVEWLEGLGYVTTMLGSRHLLAR